jgi:tetratricopeptide (TPR) repeat protein
VVSPRDTALRQAIQLKRAGQYSAAWQLLAPFVATKDARATEEAALIAELLGQKEQAIALLEQVTAMQPDLPTAWVNLAAMRADAMDPRGAAEAARTATQLAPRLIAGWINLGSALANVRDYSGAIDAFTHALRLEPDDPELIVDLAAAEFSAGEVGTAARRLQSLLATHPRDELALSLLLLVLHHATNDAVGLARAHAKYAANQGVVAPVVMASNRPALLPLRLGLVSGDFRIHSVWYFLKPLLQYLPLHGIELHCFHTDPTCDPVTELWQTSVHRFTTVAKLSDDALETLIRQSNLDVLISLGGHTTHARPSLFLRRMVPVQASFLGYPGPLGSPNVDYWIADDAVSVGYASWDPSVGQVASLPGSYFCFDPGETPPAVSLLADDTPVVFGSFNVLAKISAVTVRLWAAVLNAVPHARLLLKTGAVHGPTAARLASEFKALGIGTERIVWADWTATRDAHLAQYGSVDIALDTFPYNGATTTCEALWMGVPVISLAGHTPASRMGRSILQAAGLQDLAVFDEETFVHKAQALATDVNVLRANRSSLRDRVRDSALCDAASYAARFAAVLKQIASVHR